MPEELLMSVFNISKVEVGDPVKVTIYKDEKEEVTYGHVIEICMAHIEIGAFSKDNIPIVCVITPKHLLEETAKIEVL